jgi:hypothetical protein
MCSIRHCTSMVCGLDLASAAVPIDDKPSPVVITAMGSSKESWLRIFAQGAKWNFCLTARTVVHANQEQR